jgi:hypothetical protein
MYTFRIRIAGARSVVCGMEVYTSFAPKTVILTKIARVREFIINIITPVTVFSDVYPKVDHRTQHGYTYGIKRTIEVLKKLNIRITHYGDDYTVSVPDHLVDDYRAKSRRLNYTHTPKIA